MMEKQGGVNDKEQYVGPKYVRDHLMVSRTKAYEIVKEIEQARTPGGVIRVGRCLRVRKDIFFRWVEGQVPGGEDAYANDATRQPQKDGGLRLAG